MHCYNRYYKCLNSAAPLLGTDNKSAIKGEYIVIFKSEVSDRDGELHKFERSKGRSIIGGQIVYLKTTPHHYVVVTHVVVTGRKRTLA